MSAYLDELRQRTEQEGRKRGLGIINESGTAGVFAIRKLRGYGRELYRS